MKDNTGIAWGSFPLLFKEDSGLLQFVLELPSISEMKGEQPEGWWASLGHFSYT